MVFDPFGWSKWSPHLGNAITIALGIPTMTGILAGAWAYMSGSGLSVAMVILAVFMMTLWCCIGILWLRDRAGLGESRKGRRGADCAWGLRVEFVILSRDIAPSAFAEWQIQVGISNQLAWPLRVGVISHSVVIENIVPSLAAEKTPPPILMPNQTLSMNLPGYKRDEIAEKDRWKGIIDFSVKYGHPDGNYTRIMTRKYAFDLLLKPPAPPIPQGLQLNLIPMSGRIPIPYWSREEDTDEPYLEPRAVHRS
jgi:hypothetical protein